MLSAVIMPYTKQIGSAVFLIQLEIKGVRSHEGPTIIKFDDACATILFYPWFNCIYLATYNNYTAVVQNCSLSMLVKVKLY